MKEIILEEVEHTGFVFAKGASATCTNAAFNTELLRDAVLTGHVTPDELGAARSQEQTWLHTLSISFATLGSSYLQPLPTWVRLWFRR